MLESDSVMSAETVPASSWFKFKAVGDQVVGVYQSHEDVPAANGFNAQRVYTILTKDGDEMKVGIPVSKKRVIDALRKAAKGDIVGLRYDKELPPKQKGHSSTKVIEPHYVRTAEGDKTRQFYEAGGKADDF